MRTLAMVVLVLILCVGGLGFYRGWFSLSSHRDSTDSKVNVNLTVDPGKVKADAAKVKNEATELPGRITVGANGSGDPARNKVKSNDK